MHWFCIKNNKKSFQILENRHKITFGILKLDWDVLRSPCLLSETTMVSGNILRTILFTCEVVETFFRGLEAMYLTSKVFIFAWKLPYFHWFCVKNNKKSLKNLKNHHKFTFGILKLDWDVLRHSRMLLPATMMLGNILQAMFVTCEALNTLPTGLEVIISHVIDLKSLHFWLKITFFHWF